MRRVVIFIALCILIFLMLGTAGAVPVEWTVATGGNGHSYEAVFVPGGVTWADSKLAAENAGGYLSTIVSEAENIFVFSLVKDRPEFWQQAGPNSIWTDGPWLGGYQTSESGPWHWSTGEQWIYTNWMVGEPSPTNQYYLHFCYLTSTGQVPTWDNAGAPGYYQPYNGYIIEYSPTVPEPTTIFLLGLGLIGLAGIRRKFQS